MTSSENQVKKLNGLAALRWGGIQREKIGPKMKVYPYGLLKRKEIEK